MSDNKDEKAANISVIPRHTRHHRTPLVVKSAATTPALPPNPRPMQEGADLTIGDKGAGPSAIPQVEENKSKVKKKLAQNLLSAEQKGILKDLIDDHKWDIQDRLDDVKKALNTYKDYEIELQTREPKSNGDKKKWRRLMEKARENQKRYIESLPRIYNKANGQLQKTFQAFQEVFGEQEVNMLHNAIPEFLQLHYVVLVLEQKLPKSENSSALTSSTYTKLTQDHFSTSSKPPKEKKEPKKESKGDEKLEPQFSRNIAASPVPSFSLEQFLQVSELEQPPGSETPPIDPPALEGSSDTEELDENGDDDSYDLRG